MATIIKPMKRIRRQKGMFAESVYGRTSMVLLFTLTFSAALALIFLVNQMWLAITLKVTLVVAGALVAGLMTRKMLKEYGFWFRFFVALFTHVFNLAVLFWVTRGYIGFDLFDLNNSTPDWDGLLQIGGGLIAIWMTQMAWRHNVKIIPAKPASVEDPVAIATAHKRRFPDFLSAAHWKREWDKRPRIHWPSLPALSMPSFTGLLSEPRNWWKRTGSGSKVKIERPKPDKKTLVFRRALARKKTDVVQLSDDVEYCCPFCLEIVLPNDSRGVETCKVCKTPHHADCWEITGVCQIPHQYE